LVGLLSFEDVPPQRGAAREDMPLVPVTGIVPATDLSYAATSLEK
jgi:hypothetical protein